MPRIKDSDVALIRERARIDDVIRDVVTLKPAGGGSWKGLCPFHDERTPSFHVTPSKGFWHCFGCQAGGDVIDFVRQYEQLPFTEAVEKLAARVGVELTYEASDAGDKQRRSERARLILAHRLAAQFYAEQLETPGAAVARDFLTSRQFDSEQARQFGVGYSPDAWDRLTRYLAGQGFSDQELTAAGLVVAGSRGIYDRFRNRLMWPIRDLGGEVIGFGARKLVDDDKGPKYLNTPETAIYHKSQVLYGVDLARKEIARRQQAVIVEGYTDVMAAHLSGVETAVATCGTAFGEGHVRILRRLLMDQEELRGEVVFTFDGDEAGRRAARKAFELDAAFVGQTYVAASPDGLDPCDVRISNGPEALREMVARRVPLFDFVIRAHLDDHNLTTPAGRVAAARSVAPLIAAIKDSTLQPEYVRLVSGWIGLDAHVVSEQVARERASARKGGHGSKSSTGGRGSGRPAGEPATESGTDPVAHAVEREALKCVLHYPLDTTWYPSVEDQAYTEEIHRLLHAAVTAVGLTEMPDEAAWLAAVADRAADDRVRAYLRELLHEGLLFDSTALDDPQRRRHYCESVIARLLEMDATRRIITLKGKVQRTDPEAEPAAYDRLFRQLVELESVRRELRAKAAGDR